MTIVRALRRDEVDGVADLTARVFAKDGDYDAIFQMTKAAYLHCPFMPPELCWVAEVDGRIVAKWQVLDFRIRVGNTAVRMGGIQAVVAEPDENHKGYPGTIAAQGLSEAAGMGFDVVLGFAQRGALYRRLGAVPIMAEYELVLDARQIAPLRDDPFHEWSEAELPELIDHYNQSNEGRSGSLIRTPEHWPWMVRKAPIIHISQEGYIGVRHGPDELEIRELAGRSSAFYDAALRKLGALARAAGVRKIRGAVPVDHPFALMSIAYGSRMRTIYTKRAGCLALPLAPLRLLERIRGELDERLRNSRYFETRLELGVRCAGCESSTILNPAGSRQQKIDVSLSPGGLLQLAFGYRPVRAVLLDKSERAAETGGAAPPPDDAALALLETIFPHGHPFMWQTDRY